MNTLKKIFLGPFGVGFLYFIIILFCSNYRIIYKNQIFSFTLIGLLIFITYFIIFRTLEDQSKLKLGLLGFSAGKIISIFSFPFIIYLNSKNSKHEVRTIEDIVELNTDSIKCLDIKYGIFFDGKDTIKRFKKDNHDYELLIFKDTERLCKIKWIDDCSYIRELENNNYTKVKFGIIDSIHHNMLVIPLFSNKTEKPQLDVVKKIR